MTGAGMMDCKKALVEAKGDLDKAVDYLCAKKASRPPRERRPRAERRRHRPIHRARRQKSACWWKSIARRILSRRTTASARFATTSPKNSRESETNPDLEADRVAVVAKIRENIKIARHAKMEVSGNGLLRLHPHRRESRRARGSRRGQAGDDGQGGIQAARADITLQIAAGHPHAVSREQVAPEVIAKEREIAVLLKLSGEALGGENGIGISPEAVQHMAGKSARCANWACRWWWWSAAGTFFAA
jgi:elongation factor Ts